MENIKKTYFKRKKVFLSDFLTDMLTVHNLPCETLVGLQFRRIKPENENKHKI